MTLQVKGVLDVPDFSLFAIRRSDKETAKPLEQRFGIPHLISKYEELFKFTPESICLPITGAGGVPFDSTLGLRNIAPEDADSQDGGRYDLRQAIEQVFFAKKKLYLSLNPQLPFATNSSYYNLLDSSDDETPKCCFAKEETQDVLKQILDDAVKCVPDHQDISGIVLSLHELWPMGADGEKVEVTCFCQDCQNKIQDVSVRQFQFTLKFDLLKRTHRGPFHLALKDGGSGISHIKNLADEDGRQLGLEAFRRVLLQAGYYDDPGTFNEYSEQLYYFTKSRDVVVRGAIENVLASSNPRLKNVRRVLVPEVFPYSWNTGLYRASLMGLELDEIWAAPGAVEQFKGCTNVMRKTFLTARGRYHLHSFFDLIYHIIRALELDPDSAPQWRPRLMKYSRQLDESMHLNRMEILPLLKRDEDFVAPLVTSEYIRTLQDVLGVRGEDNSRSMMDLLRRLGGGIE